MIFYYVAKTLDEYLINRIADAFCTYVNRNDELYSNNFIKCY